METEKPEKQRQNIEIIKAIYNLNMELNFIKEEAARQKNKIDEYEKKKGKVMVGLEEIEKEMETKTHVLSL